MTQGGKEILARLRQLAKHYCCIRWDETGDSYFENDVHANEVMLNATLAMLDRFEEVEKLLNQGGFIQDTNKVLCRSGDKVTYTINSNSERTHEGTLRWSAGEGAFLIDPKEGGNGYYLWEISEWHKEAVIGS